MRFNQELNLTVAKAYQPVFQRKRWKGLRGGRGRGASWMFGQLLVYRTLTERVDAVCAREVQKSMRYSSKKIVTDTIDRLKVRKYFDIKRDEIVSNVTGSQIVFQGLQDHTADSFKSFEGFGILWMEEAQNISAQSLAVAVPTMRVDGAEIWAGWNPRSPDDPIEVRFRKNEGNPDYVCITTNYKHNPWFPETLRQEMRDCLKADPDAYRHIWLGEYEQRSEARVFHNWKVQQFETPSAVDRFYFGADWGYSVDPTVLVRCFIEGKKLYIDYELHKVGCSIDSTPAFFDSLVPSDIAVARKWPITADSARPETIDYLRRHGYPKIKGAKKGAGSVEDGIEFLKTFDIVVHPRCNHTIDELSKYSWKVDKRTDEVLPMLSDKNNHVIDALRYAVEGSRRSEAPLVRKMSYRGS